MCVVSNMKYREILNEHNTIDNCRRMDTAAKEPRNTMSNINKWSQVSDRNRSRVHAQGNIEEIASYGSPSNASTRLFNAPIICLLH